MILKSKYSGKNHTRLLLFAVMAGVVIPRTAPIEPSKHTLHKLFFDRPWKKAGLLQLFRSSMAPLAIMEGDRPSIIGLHSLKLSASEQLTEHELRTLKTRLAQNNVTLVDLRQEPHCFINNDPVHVQHVCHTNEGSLCANNHTLLACTLHCPCQGAHKQKTT